MITVMNWIGDYEVKFDKTSLTEASSKKFLEDLLTVVRRGMDRKRTYSTTSSSSLSPVTTSAPKAWSTPTPRAQQNTSITRDME